MEIQWLTLISIARAQMKAQAQAIYLGMSYDYQMWSKELLTIV